MLRSMIKTARRNVEGVVLKPDAFYRLYLKKKYRIDKPPKHPDALWENKVLKTRAEWLQAAEQVRALRLPSRSDPTKNWDTLAALNCILKRTGKTANILDAGAESYSMILPWLFLYGYKNLTGINLVFDKRIRRGPIHYDYGDITQTEFFDNTFDAISCLSVIEHGVDLDSYFKEMSRIIKPGGVLITSTDYYESPVDVKGQRAYGVPIHIFSKDEICTALDIGRKYSLRLTSPLDLNCQDKPISWARFGLDYTYLVFTLQKTI